MTTELEDCIDIDNALTDLCIAYKALRSAGEDVGGIVAQLAMAEDEIEDGSSAMLTNRTITGREMLFHLSNIGFDELDNAIQFLQRARKSRAEVRACVAFKPGDTVTFMWSTNKGYRTMIGEFRGTASDSGKVEITKVKLETPETGIQATSGVHIVDAAKVEHVR